MSLLALTALGADRPGIVSAVAGVLVAHGCNIEDTSMSILRGHFAMVMVIAAPETLDALDLDDAVRSATAHLGLVVSTRPIGDEVAEAEDETGRWTLVIYGADHPGIVHGVTRHLADRSVNIVDLTTRVTAGDPGIYAMVMEVALPANLDPDELRRGLHHVADGLGVTCTAHPSGADIL